MHINKIFSKYQKYFILSSYGKKRGEKNIMHLNSYENKYKENFLVKKNNARN